MTDYFQEMGWRELEDGEQPNHLLHMARFLIDFGMYDDNFTGEWPRYVLFISKVSQYFPIFLYLSFALIPKTINIFNVI